jgi:hypothetical protein
MEIAKRFPRVILATACVPWDEQYRFDEPLFRSQIRTLVRLRALRTVSYCRFLHYNLIRAKRLVKPEQLFKRRT